MHVLLQLQEHDLEEEWCGIDNPPSRKLQVYRVRLVDGSEAWAFYLRWGDWRPWSGDSSTLNKSLDAIAWRHPRECERSELLELDSVQRLDRTGSYERPAGTLFSEQPEPRSSRASRVSINLPVLLLDSIVTTTAVTLNISESGMLVEMIGPSPAPGSRVRFAIKLKTFEFFGEGAVVWTRVNTKDTSNPSNGVAIKFLDVQDRPKLRRELQNLQWVVGTLS